MLIIELKKLAIMSIQVTYETNHMSLVVIQQYQMHKSFLFYVFYCNLKEKDHIKEIINSKKRNIYMRNKYYYYFDLPKIRVGLARTTKK